MPRFSRVLLVYPKVPPDTYWSFRYALPLVRKKSAMPPLGLITLAALLPAGVEVRLADLNVAPLRESDLRWAQVVMVSAMLIQQASFEEVVAACRRRDLTVVAGGPYPTACPEQMNGVDHLVLGEAEDVLPLLWQDLQQGRARRIYAAERRPDMGRAVVPRCDLLDFYAYASMAVQYSRGCPFHCEFCDIWTVFGNRPRVKTAQQMRAEIDRLFALGWRGPVFVVDDNFIGHRRAVRNELLPALAAWQRQHGYVFRFFTEASIDLAEDASLMDAMREAGFNEVFVGIETPSVEALRETGKHQNLRGDLMAAVRRIQRRGLEVMGGFILGFDSDTEDIFARQVEFIRQAAIPKAMVGLLNALPGTRLFQRLQQEGRLLAASRGNNTHCLGTNFITRMAPERLQQGYRQVLAALYDPRLKNYFARCSRLLDRLENRALFQRRIGAEEIRALLRSLRRQPFTAYGLNYLAFLLRNLWKNRDVFGESIKFAIQGHHFHVITCETLKADQVRQALEEGLARLCRQAEEGLRDVRRCSRAALARGAGQWRGWTAWLKGIDRRIDRVHEDFRADLRRRRAEVARTLGEVFQAVEREAQAAHPGR